jgi:hypothetical protein
MKNKTPLYLAQGAAIAAVYVVLTLVFAPISYGEVQVRISEALTILPFFTPAAIPGLDHVSRGRSAPRREADHSTQTTRPASRGLAAGASPMG